MHWFEIFSMNGITSNVQSIKKNIDNFITDAEQKIAISDNIIIYCNEVVYKREFVVQLKLQFSLRRKNWTFFSTGKWRLSYINRGYRPLNHTSFSMVKAFSIRVLIDVWCKLYTFINIDSLISFCNVHVISLQ